MHWFLNSLTLKILSPKITNAPMFFVSKKYSNKPEGFTPPPGIEPGGPKGSALLFFLLTQGGCNTIMRWRLISFHKSFSSKNVLSITNCLDYRIKKICYCLLR